MDLDYTHLSGECFGKHQQKTSAGEHWLGWVAWRCWVSFCPRPFLFRSSFPSFLPLLSFPSSSVLLPWVFLTPSPFLPSFPSSPPLFLAPLVFFPLCAFPLLFGPLFCAFLFPPSPLSSAHAAPQLGWIRVSGGWGWCPVAPETSIANQLGVILGCILEGWALTSAGGGVLCLWFEGRLPTASS